METFIKNVVKTYPNHEKIIDYHQGYILNTTKKTKRKNKNNKAFKSSIIRAKTSITDIALCNDFQFFVTLTLDPKKIDRYDYEASSKAITNYLRYNIKKYLLVPEKHKDGAFHFHLLADIDEKLLTKYKGRIYNINNFELGFNTAIKIKKTEDSSQKIAYYIQKYITKSLASSVGYGKKRYWVSRGLKRPVKTYNALISDEAEVVYQGLYYRILTRKLTPSSSEL